MRLMPNTCRAAPSAPLEIEVNTFSRQRRP